MHTFRTHDSDGRAERGRTAAQELGIRLLTRGIQHCRRAQRGGQRAGGTRRGRFERRKHECESGRGERGRGQTRRLHLVLKGTAEEKGGRHIDDRHVECGGCQPGVARGPADGRRERVAGDKNEKTSASRDIVMSNSNLDGGDSESSFLAHRLLSAQPTTAPCGGGAVASH